MKKKFILIIIIFLFVTNSYANNQWITKKENNQWITKKSENQINGESCFNIVHKSIFEQYKKFSINNFYE